ncbi:AraC family transcriptional regulator [Pseudomonas sp. FW306-02-F02-AA]|uniref:AraC family transcriptional regulator n=1 Tax=Pseudomonas fluorescens TaxID=294 RepID=A0A0N9VKR2_PSEFL|nr:MULTISPECIES: helix-turn-helix transcriptional regulator [Pseudomonas]ALI00441.1 AraC family transcriptional regulator [Pseudomonas fluorescens]PMZ01202.1 AraC family transcriptional regulator [Pseudomonas sp. FW306-02-F02-AB]PMZ07139.1 AraC family transcriptional regulator [Pseudomonas sp. FW306-02-H06C]PMZ16356.1 AraC family transcriptional regulator [Pseudomonas sp. FW306-02-F02-AA]PMZ22297.1 AraC family transcriptional regulator [Pseudomonas sp. FW306-02-F08-AA]
MTARTALATLAGNYGHGDIVASHRHAEGQLVYAISGVMLVSVSGTTWVVPSGHALWVPSGMEHEIRMTGEVRMRTLLITPGAHDVLTQECQVIKVSPLLRELIVAAGDQSDDKGALARHAQIVELIFSELDRAQKVLAHVPIPTEPRLKLLCAGFIDNPSQDSKLESWAEQLNMSSRTLARLFQKELGMSYGEWRKRTRLLLCLQRLASGVSILDVALEHGYQSPSAFAAMFKRTMGFTPSHCRSA